MTAKYINKTDTLEQWRVKANEVYGTVGDLVTLTKNAAVTYSGIVGQNANDFTGTAATFSITRTAGVYSVSITSGGSGYAVNDTVLVLGSTLGGADGVNDATITITSVDPGFAADGASISGTGVGDIISEVNALRDEMGSLLNFSLNTDAQTFYEAVNELETALRGAASNYNLNTDATDVVAALNELETAVRGVLTNYTLNTDADDIVNAINEHEAELGHVEDFDAQGTSSQADANHTITYVDLGSTVVSGINALKDKADYLADQIGGDMATDYDGPDNNILDALDSLYSASSLSTLDNTYVRRSGTLDMTGLFQVHQDGITSNANNLLFKTGAADVTAMTISATNQNIGLGGAPGTHKVKVTGSVNATTGFYYNGDDTDTRYVRTDTGNAQVVEIDTSFAGSTSLVPAIGKQLEIAGSIVASDSYNFLEWTQDQVGAMFTGNIENGGISGVYDDSTGKITLAIANNSHNHVSTNITDWDEAVQDTVGLMFAGNTENGVTLDYNDTTGKINVDVNDPVISISGEAYGSATMTNLGNTNISVTLDHEAIQDAVGEMVSGNTETGLSVTYNDAANKLDFTLTASPVVALSGDVSGSVTLTNLATGTYTINAVVADDSHNHVVGNVDGLQEYIFDTVGSMVDPTNTEAGITVWHDDATNKLNFDVNDVTFTLTGDVTGTATQTNLNSVTITTTIANDSHTHDTRYYTEAESDSRFVNVTGDTITGNLQVNGTITTNSDLYVGSNGGGNSLAHFYDDNNDTWRTLQYDQSNWYVEDDGGTNRLIMHSGNIGTQSVTNATNATNSTYSDYTYVTRDDSTNTTYYPIFASIGSAQQRMRNDGGLSYNPSTNTLATGIFSGTATSARYADLAEKYIADAEYPVGTVISVGGTAEVTASDLYNAHSVLGVVSENPAYMMNSELEGGTYIALKGRVPVNVIGSVRKGDRLAPSHEAGLAIVNNAKDAWSFAIALHDSDNGVVEAVIL